METRETTIDATTDDGDMAVVVTEPGSAPAEGGEWPIVVIFIDAPGIRRATREYMSRLAGHGYRVITPDLHHRQGRLCHIEPEDVQADPSIRQRVWEWISAMSDDQIQHDLDRALVAAGVDERTPFAAIGFCLGARAVFRTMMRLPQRAVAGAGWHPSFLADDAPDSPHLTAAQLTGPLYLGIGEADEVQSIAMHQRFLDAVAPLDHVTVRTFAGADHGFTWPGYPTHDETAAETSWHITLDMFATALS